MQTVIRSRRDLKIGDIVEGRKILEKVVVAASNAEMKRFGIFDYTVDMTAIVLDPKKPGGGGGGSVGNRVDLSSSPIVSFARFGRRG
jgi:hypothetical protein